MSRKQRTAVGIPLLAAAVFVAAPRLWGHVPPGVTLVDGKMTGGGSIFTGPNDVVNDRDGNPVYGGAEIRITHGFQLHCNPNHVPNNLQINIHTAGGTNRFHLEMLGDAACWDDPSITPNPPDAPFDHYFGFGLGRYNGDPGYCAKWIFTDAGEPGTNDFIKYFVIWHCSTDRTILGISEPGHPLRKGNHQAHSLN
jgi:hypothetical protein